MQNMKEISFSVLSIDAELLLTVVNQMTCQGKEGAIQLLRIIHALENAIIKSEDDDASS